MRILLLLLLLPFGSFAQFGGTWFSSFTVMGQPFEMRLLIVDGSWSSATIEDMSNDTEFACDSLEMGDSTLFFQWTKGGLNYHGTLNKDGSIEGQMRQRGITWDASFTRERQKIKVLDYWQVPIGPFPYSTDSVQIKNGEISLGASLVLPENYDATTPIVILASGSGAQNRDSQVLGHRPFAVIADHLARNGIGSLRFDDRQTGTSTGKYREAGVADFGSDVVACAIYLRKKMKFKKNPVGILGHSEGGMHALIAATTYKKIDFLIQYAALGISGKETLIEQQYAIPKARGRNEEICRWNQNLFIGMSRIVSSVPEASATDSLIQFLGSQYDNAPASYDKFGSSRQNFIINNVAFPNNKWGREFLAFEVAPYLHQLKIPLLAMHCEKDVQVNSVTNSKAFESYDNAECHIIPAVNHLGQHCTTCSIEEYGNLEETIAPEILELLTQWVLNQM